MEKLIEKSENDKLPIHDIRMSLIHWIIDRTDDELAEIWVQLNCWEWPKIIPTEYKPKWWDVESGNYHTKYNNTDRKCGFNDPIMDYCKARVNSKLIDKKWKERTNSL
jgi:hypothetical protein